MLKNFEKTPSLYRLEDLLKSTQNVAVNINGKWVPARGIGFFSFKERIKLSWLVFTGKADVLIWPEGQ